MEGGAYWEVGALSPPSPGHHELSSFLVPVLSTMLAPLMDLQTSLGMCVLWGNTYAVLFSACMYLIYGNVLVAQLSCVFIFFS